MQAKQKLNEVRRKSKNYTMNYFGTILQYEVLWPLACLRANLPESICPKVALDTRRQRVEATIKARKRVSYMHALWQQLEIMCTCYIYVHVLVQEFEELRPQITYVTRVFVRSKYPYVAYNKPAHGEDNANASTAKHSKPASDKNRPVLVWGEVCTQCISSDWQI